RPAVGVPPPVLFCRGADPDHRADAHAPRLLMKASVGWKSAAPSATTVRVASAEDAWLFRPTAAAPLSPPYWAAARIGTCALRKLRTLLMMRCLSSSGSLHGKTVISELGASEATSMEVCSGCEGVSSGSTKIGVWQFLMKSRGTLYRKLGWARHRLWKYLS